MENPGPAKNCSFRLWLYLLMTVNNFVWRATRFLIRKQFQSVAPSVLEPRVTLKMVDRLGTPRAED